MKQLISGLIVFCCPLIGLNQIQHKMSAMYQDFPSVDFYEFSSFGANNIERGGKTISMTHPVETNDYAWVNYLRMSKRYDSLQYIVEDTWASWQGETWVNSSTMTFTYDENHELLQRLQLSWDDTEWINYRRHSYIYNTDGERIERLTERWSEDHWDNYQRFSYGYSENGFMIYVLYEPWVAETWINDSQEFHSYNDSGLRDSIIAETWFGSAWSADWKNTYYYNPDSTLSEIYWYQWVDGVWEYNQKAIYTYDADGILLQIMYMNWESGNWVDYLRSTFSYDANGLLHTETNDFWGYSGWPPIIQWLPSNQYKYSYDEAENLTETIWTRWLEIVNIEDQMHRPLTFLLSQNFPNPFNPTTTISFKLPEISTVSLTIYDVKGQEIISIQNGIKPPGNYEVLWGGLDRFGNQVSTGVYFCRLDAGDYSKTIKMVCLR
ncbi:MAG: T9SS type A sorting domain-containing protein [FCB group bacterium]|nr:T9SS type A sorting domain-containing protein [FCB group bacterium]